ncbi:MAG: hypothetical protein J6K42_01140 [Clostridia bacterium]|nr:hypothetical protein [Clostridia bacterium]
MDSKPIRRKSINLILLIFIILSIITLIIISVYLINFSSKNDETENTATIQNTENNSIKMGINTNNTQSENNISKNNNYVSNSIENFENFEDINTNEITPQTSYDSNTITFNDHILTFDDSVNASIIQTTNIPELQLSYPDFNFKMLLNTNRSTSFESLKNNTSLKSYLESKYNISITSPLKFGNINNLDMIICTISDNNGNAYFIITPLSDSEIMYSKIYNTSDNQSLIEDLTKPLEEISSMISKLQN